MNQLERTITSLEVAEMVGREHSKVMRDIRTVIGHLGGQSKIGQSENSQLGQIKNDESYFIESTYTNSQNKQQPCFLLTKKGCELYSTRMTGAKGTQFAVAYIERFNQMEEHIKQQEIDKSQLSPQLQMFGAMFESQAKIELKQKEQEQRIQQVEQKQENIEQILSLNPVEWRKKVTKVLNRIAEARGGFEEYRNVRNESYESLEQRGRCLLERRLSNRKKEMICNGVPKSKVNKLSKLDVIAEDARLTEIYLAIVKEFAIKYQVNAEGLGA